MDRYLEVFSPPVVWNFILKQLQDPNEVIEYLKGKCFGCSREARLTAICWTLASIYQRLLNFMQHPQRKERENRRTGAAATPDPVTGTAGEPENHPMLISVVPILKKKHTKKSVLFVRDDDEPRPS